MLYLLIAIAIVAGAKNAFRGTDPDAFAGDLIAVVVIFFLLLMLLGC